MRKKIKKLIRKNIIRSRREPLRLIKFLLLVWCIIPIALLQVTIYIIKTVWLKEKTYIKTRNSYIEITISEDTLMLWQNILEKISYIVIPILIIGVVYLISLYIKTPPYIKKRITIKDGKKIDKVKKLILSLVYVSHILYWMYFMIISYLILVYIRVFGWLILLGIVALFLIINYFIKTETAYIKELLKNYWKLDEINKKTSKDYRVKREYEFSEYIHKRYLINSAKIVPWTKYMHNLGVVLICINVWVLWKTRNILGILEYCRVDVIVGISIILIIIIVLRVVRGLITSKEENRDKLKSSRERIQSVFLKYSVNLIIKRILKKKEDTLLKKNITKEEEKAIEGLIKHMRKTYDIYVYRDRITNIIVYRNHRSVEPNWDTEAYWVLSPLVYKQLLCKENISYDEIMCRGSIIISRVDYELILKELIRVEEKKENTK